MANKRKLSRRDFLASSTKTAAALSIGSSMMTSTAAAAQRKIGANDRITIALIGCGQRGVYDAWQAMGAGNIACAALCDVAEFRFAGPMESYTKTMEANNIKGVKIDTYDDYRRVLDRKDIDAVMITTPDHWHCQIFLDAVAAGKHIYEEKPMSHSIEHGQKMLAAANKRPELTIQIGTQRRSDKQYHKAKAFIADGKLGDIRFARAWDTRNWVTKGDPFAPKEVSGKIDWDKFQEPCRNKRPYDPWRYFTWRWYWDYAGGLVTDVGVHVMDIVHMLTGKSVPKSAVCNGGTYAFKRWETPDVVTAVWDYGTHSVEFNSNFTNGFHRDGLNIYGTKGTMEVRGREIFVWAEGKRDEPIAKFPREAGVHQHNWIRAIRGEEKINAPVHLGVSSLLPSHLANLSYRLGKKITWDPVAQKAT